MTEEPRTTAEDRRRRRAPAALVAVAERHAASPAARARTAPAATLLPHEAVRLVELLAAGTAQHEDAEPRVDADDLRAALTLLPQVRAELDETELGLLVMARGRGLTWAEVAEGLGLGSAQAAQQRHDRLAARTQPEG
ncbi:hypothetical protein ACFFOM_05630 [Microlunatus capsulatus]|uniref:DNA-binding protein n=1 Tax=Microlunatus capsulatus TaxID=99117 RepID=A0ABS4Z5B1_9ACTN|nr:hypothetical protein [Microlunatus capsulatus]MBP2416196.1 hypothetical protein [Microlunatus capsulatus]